MTEEPQESSKDAIVNGAGLIGLALIAVGAWWLSPAWSLVAVGSLLLTGSIVGALR